MTKRVASSRSPSATLA